MNRLYLVGNGFDLAHKLKTTYKDFILNYLSECFHNVNHGIVNDELLEIRLLLRVENWTPPVSPTINDFLYALIDENGKHKRPDHNGSYYRFFGLRIKHPFFEHILVNCANFNWVNIENEYFKHLKAIFHETGGMFKVKKEERLNSLNLAMEYLVNRMDKYFLRQQRNGVNNQYRSIFSDMLFNNEFVSLPNNKAQIRLPIESMILNFNYTNSVESYVNEFPNFRVNYIHGKAGDVDNPIIFGFGDEMDSDYSAMELNENRGFLKFMKSFGYFKTSNYFELVRFIESDVFQIVILGHSCGLSDRTMLNMLFEHQNCISIKIYYHNYLTGNNYRVLTEEISKHFRDKVSMRRKIVPFELSKEMPQLS